MIDRKTSNRKLIDLRRKLRKTATDAERMLWNIVKGKKMQGYKFYRQYSIANYILDIYCPRLKLCIEIDGGQHNDPEIRKTDQTRSAFLEQRGIEVLRFWNNEVLENPNGIYLKIQEEIDKRK